MADVPAPRAACVTGVSRGLGVALATELLAHGFEVTGIGRSAHASLAHPRFRFVAADLSRLDTLDALATEAFDAMAARAPASAVLINNAATASPVGSVGSLAADEIAAAFAANLAAPAILANAFVRSLRGRVPSRVVDVTSGSAARAMAGTAAYCAAKAGLEMWNAAAAAGASPGIEFVVLRPGIIDTPMQELMRTRDPEALPEVALFRDFHASGSLQSPVDTARRIVERVVLAPVANGAVLRYQEL
jgi:NAD(P)-dependent dehydrogenase (short-subunit alcohol dehydrogenase family)